MATTRQATDSPASETSTTGHAMVDPLIERIAILETQLKQITEHTCNQQQQKLPRGIKVPRPPEFDGKQPTPVNWCFSMYNYLVAEGGGDYLNAPNAVHTAAAYFRGTALNWWRQHEHEVYRGLVPEYENWYKFQRGCYHSVYSCATRSISQREAGYPATNTRCLLVRQRIYFVHA